MALLRKMTCNLRHSMGLRHPVCMLDMHLKHYTCIWHAFETLHMTYMTICYIHICVHHIHTLHMTYIWHTYMHYIWHAFETLHMTYISIYYIHICVHYVRAWQTCVCMHYAEQNYEWELVSHKEQACARVRVRVRVARHFARCTHTHTYTHFATYTHSQTHTNTHARTLWSTCVFFRLLESCHIEQSVMSCHTRRTQSCHSISKI